MYIQGDRNNLGCLTIELQAGKECVQGVCPRSVSKECVQEANIYRVRNYGIPGAASLRMYDAHAGNQERKHTWWIR
jgi:hypothetical protein